MLEKPYRVAVEYGGLTVRLQADRCKRCGCHINRERVDFSSTEKPVRSFPLFMSSDGFFVASQRFMKFSVSNGFLGAEFFELENGYFVLRVGRCVSYDLEKFDYLKQSGWCDECQSFASSLTSPYERVLSKKSPRIEPLEIVESCDIWGEESGSGTAKGPDLLVGPHAGHLLKEAKFRGIRLRETS